MTAERWLPVVGLAGRYEVSDLGGFRNSRTGVIRRPGPNRGYQQVNIMTGGRRIAVKIHRAVLEAFVGPCPAGMECRHRDNNPSNNHLTNLAWGTPVENAADRAAHGTQQRGTGVPSAVLTEAGVTALRQARANGSTLDQLAARFGVSAVQASRIASGQAWRHVTTVSPSAHPGAPNTSVGPVSGTALER